MKKLITITTFSLSFSCIAAESIAPKVQVVNYQTSKGNYEVTYVSNTSTKNIVAKITRMPISLKMGIAGKNLRMPEHNENAFYCGLYSKKDLLNSVEAFNEQFYKPIFPANDYELKNKLMRESYVLFGNHAEVEKLFKADFSSYDVKFLSLTKESTIFSVSYTRDARIQGIENYIRAKDALTKGLHQMLSEALMQDSLELSGEIGIKINYRYLWCDLYEGKAKIYMTTTDFTEEEKLSYVDILSDKKQLKDVIDEIYRSDISKNGESASEDNFKFLAGMIVGKALKAKNYIVNNKLLSHFKEQIYTDMFLPLFKYNVFDGFKLKYSKDKALKYILYKNGKWENGPRFSHETLLESAKLSGESEIEIYLMEASKWND